jgi:hypothetical protein
MGKKVSGRKAPNRSFILPCLRLALAAPWRTPASLPNVGDIWGYAVP